MVNIKYVGVKADGERAFKDDTGIEWFAGDVHEVSEENAAKMLRHPDVFVQVDGEPVEPAPAPKLNAVSADQDEVDDAAIAREEAAKKAKADAASKPAAKKTAAPPKVKAKAKK
jgi:hypothetical protein